MIAWLINAAIMAAILSFIPWVKHKGFGACFAVAAVMGILNAILGILALPAMFIAFVTSFIPFLGILIAPLSILLLVWFVNTLALYIADQMIEDFEISSFAMTGLTSLVLSVCYTIISLIIN